MIDSIKKLREVTSLSMKKIKEALEKSGGDEDKALEILKSESKGVALKKSSRGAKEGIIESYIHSNKKIGVLLKLYCETDFVAKSEEFKELAHNLAMHIAAMDPENLEDLMAQQYIKDESIKIKDLTDDYISKLGENIKVGEFVRFEV